MAESPLFRVGDDVELWRMLLNFTVLALVVMAFEKALHVLEKRVEQYPKYHQMITKVYRELMILGVLGLGIKMLKEAGLVIETSPEMVAFVSADLTIFFLAVALIFQAITIFLQLRMKNKQMDNLELIGSEDLLALAVAHERRRNIHGAVWRAWSANKYSEEIRIRIFRNLFLRMHGLPEIFPFAKYLRQAQDNQITHMIDIELSMWLLVFLVAWSINASINVLGDSELFAFDEDDESEDSRLDEKTREEIVDAKSHYALAVVFALYSWILLILHLITLYFFESFLDKLLQRAGVKSNARILERLEQVAIEEVTNLASEVTGTAIQRMEDVLEQQQVQQYKRHHHLIKHDTGFQLLATGCRKFKAGAGKRRSSGDDGEELQQPWPIPPPQDQTHSTPAVATTTTPSAAATTPIVPPSDELQIPGFSRNAWHFALKLFLILNGLYIALFVQTMVSHLVAFMTTIGVFLTLLIPLPLIINWFVQTDLMRKYILISSLSKVHVETLSDVISDFTEAVQLQNSFISSILCCLEERGRSINELALLFEGKDLMESGWIDVEEMRQILSAALGFQMSFFKFNSVMRLLFQLRHLKVDYRKVITLLTLASEQHDGHDGGGHHHMSVITLNDPHDPHYHYHHELLHPEMPSYSEKASFVMMEGSRGFSSSFASSTALMQDGLQRPSKITRQMMGNNYNSTTTRSTTATLTRGTSGGGARQSSFLHQSIIRQPSLTTPSSTSISSSTAAISSAETTTTMLRAATNGSILSATSGNVGNTGNSQLIHRHPHPQSQSHHHHHLGASSNPNSNTNSTSHFLDATLSVSNAAPLSSVFESETPSSSDSSSNMSNSSRYMRM